MVQSLQLAEEGRRQRSVAALVGRLDRELVGRAVPRLRRQRLEVRERLLVKRALVEYLKELTVLP